MKKLVVLLVGLLAASASYAGDVRGCPIFKGDFQVYAYYKYTFPDSSVTYWSFACENNNPGNTGGSCPSDPAMPTVSIDTHNDPSYSTFDPSSPDKGCRGTIGGYSDGYTYFFNKKVTH